MFYSVRGMAAAVVLIAGVTAYTAIDKGMNYQVASASVVTIDRICDLTETSEEDGQTVKRNVSDTCSSVDEWDSVKEKRNKVVSGRAVVHLSYVAPQDGSQQVAELDYTGRDGEFYELKAGDEIEILVSDDDPSKIRRA
jgi:hypothetical protein